MSLTWRGLSADDFAEFLEDSSVITRRESKRVLRQGAKDIMEASKQMAPVDDGELEEAHEIAVVRLNKDDMEVEITVGGNVGGVDVDEYAWEQHETLTPAGDWQLGKRSQAKNASNPPNRSVGGKFLERAVDEYEDEIAIKIADTLPGD